MKFTEFIPYYQDIFKKLFHYRPHIFDKYCISANSFRGNYFSLNLAIKVRKVFKGGNYSMAETIRRNTVNIISAVGGLQEVLF